MKRQYPHTELPFWNSGGCILAGDPDRPNLVATRYSFHIINEHGEIYDLRDGGGGFKDSISPVEADSNAALLVTAANYHDNLVAAAKRLLTNALQLPKSTVTLPRPGSTVPGTITVDLEDYRALSCLLEKIAQVIKIGDV